MAITRTGKLQFIAIACAISVLFHLSHAHAQTARQPKKCVEEGRITYTDGDCPNGSEQKRAADRLGSTRIPPLPGLQSGLWKLSVNNNGNTTMTDYCGDPLDFFRIELLGSEEKIRETGCTLQGSSSVPNQVIYTIVCPADKVTVNGGRVKKGRSELRVTAPTPQSYTTDWDDKTGLNRRQIVQGTRVGNCN